MIVAVINGWIVQKYGNRPGVMNIYENESPWASDSLSQSLGPSCTEATVWACPSKFLHVNVVPTAMVRFSRVKLKIEDSTNGPGVAVGVGIAVGLGVGVGKGVAVGAGVSVGMGVGVGVGVGATIGVAVGDGVAEDTGDGVGGDVDSEVEDGSSLGAAVGASSVPPPQALANSAKPPKKATIP